VLLCYCQQFQHRRTTFFPTIIVVCCARLENLHDRLYSSSPRKYEDFNLGLACRDGVWVCRRHDCVADDAADTSVQTGCWRIVNVCCTYSSLLWKPFQENMSVSNAGLTGEKTDCWNEAAGSAGCDPNIDDDCLCGPFFDDVAGCTAALCNAGENLGMLQFSVAGPSKH
jgi:hypothetical protein